MQQHGGLAWRPAEDPEDTYRRVCIGCCATREGSKCETQGKLGEETQDATTGSFHARAGAELHRSLNSFQLVSRVLVLSAFFGECFGI